MIFNEETIKYRYIEKWQQESEIGFSEVIT